jgi:hypothetical protein
MASLQTFSTLQSPDRLTYLPVNRIELTSTEKPVSAIEIAVLKT